MNVDVRRQALK